MSTTNVCLGVNGTLEDLHNFGLVAQWSLRIARKKEPLRRQGKPNTFGAKSLDNLQVEPFAEVAEVPV